MHRFIYSFSYYCKLFISNQSTDILKNYTMRRLLTIALFVFAQVALFGQITNTLVWEKWNGNMTLAALSAAENPDETLTIYELGNQDRGDNYMARIRGYIIPQETGEYTFWVASDDDSEFWLSTDFLAENKELACYVTGYSSYFQFDKYPEQRSDSIFMVAGESYYFELLHHEGGGGDHAEVAWTRPGEADGTKNLINSPYISETVNDDESLKSILSFEITGLDWPAFYTIDRVNHTIDVELAAGTDLTTLVPEFTISNGATASPESGSSVDFTNPVTITITAADNSTVDYTVTVTELPLQTEGLVTRFYLEPLNQDAVIDNDANTITYNYFIGYTKDQRLTLSASLYATTTLEDGMTFPVDDPPAEITVTAQDGTVKTYSIIANGNAGVKGFSDDFSTADHVDAWRDRNGYEFTHDAADEQLQLQMSKVSWADTDFTFPEGLNLYDVPLVRIRVTADRPVNKDGIQIGLVDSEGNGARDWQTNINTKIDVPNQWYELTLDFSSQFEQYDHVELGEITKLYFHANRSNVDQGGGSDALIFMDDFRVGEEAFPNHAPTVDQPVSPDWTYLADGPQSVTLTGITDGNPERDEIIAITAASSDQDVVKDEDINVTYDGSSETAEVSYSGTSRGFCTITVYVQDNRGAVYSDENDIDSVQFVAQFRDNTPGVNNIATFDIPYIPDYFLGTGQNIIVVPNVDDGDEGEEQDIVFTLENQNTEVLTIDSLVYHAGDRMALIYFTELGVGGQAAMTLSCQDQVDIDAGGSDIFSLEFTVSPSLFENPGVWYGATDVQQWQEEPYKTNVVFKEGYPLIFPAADIRDHCKEDLFWGKMWGYIVAPESGDYQFQSKTDGEGIGNFYLSTDHNSENLPGSATASNGTPSALVTLEQGKAYYFEAYHKEIINTYQLTISWSGPGFAQEVIEPPYLVSGLDLQKPSSPANCHLLAKGSEEVIVTWDESIDDNRLAGYKVLVNGYVYLDSIFTSTSARVTGLEKESTYSIVVLAVDEFKNHSLPSGKLTFTTYGDDANAPSAPGNLTVAGTTIYSILLSWDASTDAETEVYGYNVYQDGSSEPLNSVPMQDLEFKVSGLESSTQFDYVVKAVDAAGNESDASNQATVTTLAFDWENTEEEEMIGQVDVTLTPVTKATGFAVEGGFHLSGLLVSNKVSYGSFESENITDFASSDDLNKVEKVASNVTVSPENEDVYDGNQSLKLTTSAGGYFRNHASITMSPQYTYLVRFAAKKDVDYSNDDIDIRVLKTTGGNVVAHQSTVNGLTTDWQVFEIEFTGIENALNAWWIEWGFTSAGTVYFDNVEMHIKEYYDPASKFTTIGMDILQDLKLAGIRWGAIDANFESLSNSSGPYQTNTLTYADFAYISNLLGGYSLITVGVNDGAWDNDGTIEFNSANATDFFKDKNTFTDFMEYLGGDGSTEWGAKRIAEGYTENLFESNNAVVIELGNEVWGSIAHGAYSFGSDYPYYTDWSNDVAGNYIKESPFYNPDKVFVSISGRSPDQSSSVNEQIYENPNDELDWISLSGYMGGNMNYEAGVDPGDTELDYHKNGYVNFHSKINGLHKNQRNMLKSMERIMPAFFYEGNMTTTTYHGSLGQAITFGDYYATGMENGVAIPSVFCLQGGQWRLIDDLPTLRKRPMYYVTRAYNNAAQGGVILKSELHSMDTIYNSLGNPIDLPSLGVHAFADGENYSVVLFSRSFERNYHAKINLPDDIGTISNGEMYTLTGESYNSTTVTEETVDVTITDGMVVTVPVHGMVVLTFTADDKELDAPIGNLLIDQAATLSLTTEDDRTLIDERLDDLEVYAHLSPDDIFIKDLKWEVVGNDPEKIKLVNYGSYIKVKALGKNNGTVTIVASTLDGSGLSEEVEIEITNQISGIEKEFADLGIEMYPNPAKEQIFVELPFDKASFSIISAQGAVVINHDLFSGRNELNVAALQSGLYFLRVETPEGVAVKKFVKQ